MPASLRCATCSRSSAENLAETDRRFLKFAQEFEKRFVGRGEDGDRAIIVALAIAWQRLSLLPPESLACVGEADLAKYRHWERETEAE